MRVSGDFNERMRTRSDEVADWVADAKVQEDTDEPGAPEIEPITPPADAPLRS